MFHTKFKQIRQTRNMSQEQLAMLAQMPVSEVAQLEEDENTMPTFMVVQKLAQALDTSVDYFASASNKNGHGRFCGTTMLKICHIPPKGRGVIATQPILAGTVVEIAPVRSFPAKDRPIVDQTDIFEYYFVKPSAYQQSKEVGGHLIFGLATFCNHADEPNVKIEWYQDDLGEWAHLVALNDIVAGEEVTLYYTNVDEYPNLDKFV